MASYAWASPVSGDWSTMGDWTGGVPDSATASVSIAVAGTYTVAVTPSDSFSAGSLTLAAQGATLSIAGTLDLASTLNLSAGTLYLSGDISGGTIIVGAGSIAFAQGTLTNVTVQGVFSLSSNPLGRQTVYISSGLTVTGAGGVGSGAIQDTSRLGGGIYFNNTQTFNNATVDIGSSGGSAGLYENNTTSTNQVLTFGRNLTIDQVGLYGQMGTAANGGGTIVNLGTINLSAAGGRMTITGAGFVNEGVIAVSSGDTLFAQNLTNAAGGVISIGAGSTFLVAGGFTNSGTVTVAAGGLLDFQGAQSVTTAALTGINAAANTIEIDGTLNNSGAVLDVGAGTALGQIVFQGTLNGGTVVDSGDGFAYDACTFNDVTYQGTIDLSTTSVKYQPTLFISGGLNISGVGGVGTGTIEDTGLGSRLAFDNTQTINNVTINVGTINVGASLIENDTTGTGQTLTLGPNTTLNIMGYLAAIGAQGGVGDAIINQGTINLVTQGVTLNITGPNFINEGMITTGVWQAVYAQNLTNAAGATITVNPDTLVSISGSFANAGTVQIAQGSTLIFQQYVTLTTAALGNIQATDSSVIMNGVLNNAGSTLTLGAGTALATLTLAGTINGGLIKDNGSGGQFAGGTLNGVTYYGTMDMSGTTFQPYLTIGGGLTLEGVGGVGPGLIQLTGSAASLMFAGTQTFDNATINIGATGSTDVIEQADQSGKGQTLTLGAKLTINQVGASAQLAAAGAAGDVVVNDGTIDAIATGGAFAILGSNFSNLGHIVVSNGDTLSLQPVNFTNLSGSVLTGGSFEVDTGSTIELSQNVAIATDNASIILSGAGSIIQSYNTTTNSQVTIDSTLTAIGVTGSLALLGGRNFSTASFRNSGILTLGGGVFTATAGFTNNAGGTVTGRGAIAASIANSGVIDASGGALTLQGGVTGSGGLQINANATLVLAGSGAVSETVTMKGAGATLALIVPSAFSGKVLLPSTGGDYFDLLKTAANSVTFNSSDQLVVSNNGRVVARIQLVAADAGFNYILQSDGNGGTTIFAGYNDPPIVTTSGSLLVQAGHTSIVAGIGIIDGDAVLDNKTITAVVSDTNGLLSVNPVSGATVSGSGTTSLTLVGSLNAVDAELATLTYTAQSAGGAANDAISVAVSDGRGGSGSGSVAVSINQPVITTTPATALIIAGEWSAVNGISVADADAVSANETITVVLTDNAGLLSAVASAGATVVGAGSTSLTLAGSLSAVNAELATLTDCIAVGTTSDMINIATSDGRGSSNAQKIAVSVNQTVLTQVPAAISFASGVANPVTGISVTDAAGENITMVLSDTLGILSVVAVGGKVSGSGTNSVTITGTLPQVAAELATLTYTGAPSGGAATGSDTINVQSSDSSGNTNDHTIAVSLIGDTSSWLYGKSNDWSVAAAWSAGVPSSPQGTAQISLAGAYTISIAASESFSVSNLTMSAARTTLAVTGSLAVSGLLTLSAGTIQLNPGGYLKGTVCTAAKSSIAGAGALVGAVVNNGTIAASGGALVVSGGINGTGALQIDGGSSLELGNVGAGQTITFASGGANQTLILDSPGAMLATVKGFGVGETIDIAGMAVTSDYYSGGVLSLYSGSQVIGTLTIARSFFGEIFALSSDGHGGTDLTLAADAPPAIKAPSTVAIATPTATHIAGVSVADADAVSANEILKVTLTDSVGRLAATAAGGATIAGNVRKMTITGTLAEVDAVLSTLTAQMQTAGSDTITISANDGYGGSSSRTIALTATAAPQLNALSAVPDAGLLAQYVAAGLGSPASGAADGIGATQPRVEMPELAAHH